MSARAPVRAALVALAVVAVAVGALSVAGSLSSASDVRAMSGWPSMRTDPSDGRSSPPTMFRNVDFPEPERPITPTICPSGMRSVTWSARPAVSSFGTSPASPPCSPPMPPRGLIIMKSRPGAMTSSICTLPGRAARRATPSASVTADGIAPDSSEPSPASMLPTISETVAPAKIPWHSSLC